MASSMDKLAKELKKQMTASDERKPKPYDTQAEVLRVEDGVAWVHIPGGVDETPVRLTINAKKGDNVNLHVANGTAWITGNSTNPPTDDSTANYAVNISNEVKKDVTVLNNIVVDVIEATNARFTNVEADTAKIHDLTADNLRATVGYIDDLTADSITANDISAASGYIKDLTADSITAQDISAATGFIDDLIAGNVTAQNVIADHATVGSLDANYAQIDMANVNNAWIENGAIKKAEVFDENVFDLSGNRATLSRIDASKINVANLRADNLVVRRINGQPVVGGYTLIDSNSPQYETKNPQALGWYEFVNAEWVLSTDNTVDMTKAYYQEGNEVSLYDQAYIDALEDDLQQQIDGAVETYTGTVVPTLVNKPYTDWYDTSVTPIHDERAKHIGDIYYVVNSAASENGYCYRFAYDNTSHAYSWVLIKDSDVTKALSDISELKTFESNTTSWMDETDEGLETIRTNHTALSGVVDKTVKESVQLWFTKANTTAPAKPTAEVTSTSTAGNAWRKVVPAWNASYPNYYYCWQYKFVDGTFGWSDVVRDIAMGETQGTARDAKNTADAALPASTFTSFESTTFKNVKDTVDEQTTKFTNMTTRLGLNSDGTGANTDIVAKESALEQTVEGVSSRVSKTETKLAGMYATSSTAAGTAAKVATITPALPSGATWELGTGTIITVKFTNANTAASPTLNVNSKGAKAIKTYANGNLTEDEYKWKAGSTFTFIYNGTNWLMQDSSASVRMNSAETGITQNAEQIALRAKSSDVYTKGQVYTKTEADSAITQKANKISLSVAQTEISKIEIGGRNLLRRTKTYEGWEKVSSITLTQDKEGITVANWPQVSTASWREIRSSGGEELFIPYSLVRDREVTLSCWFKMDAIPTSNINDILYAIFSLNNAGTYTGNRKKYTSNVFSGKIEQTTNWQHVVWTGTVSDSLFSGGTGTIADTDLFYTQIYNHNLPATHVKKVKLEYGNRVTDWTPAPEDVEDYTDTQVSAAKAEIKVTTDGISTEVAKKTDKETIISTIRQSAESVKIKASQVEIDGTATFNAIKSSTDAAYDAKGAASSAETNAKDYADGAVADKADKSNAVARTQRIYYRKTSSGAPSANKTWLATSGTGYGNWSLKVPQMTSGTTKYPYLYTAVQTQTVAQMAAGNACSCSAVLLDDTTTVIDGGSILTNSIGANKIKVNELTIGQTQVSGLSTALANTKKLYKHNVDLTGSSYNQDTWYPVLIGECPATDSSIYFKCSIINGGGTPSWSLHPSKHWACEVEALYSVSRWGWKLDDNSYIDAYTFGQTSTKPIVLSNALSHTGYLVVYLRGGGYYPIQTSIADTPQIKTSSYTIYSQTVAPTTTQPANTTNFVISRREGDTKTNEAAKTATTYITHIDNNGIRVHPSSTQNNSVVINANGMEVFKGGTAAANSVAFYGDTARIGKESGSHLTLASDSMSMSDGVKDVFNVLQKTMYIRWTRNYKGRQFTNSTDRHIDSWDTNTSISTWDSITVNYKLNNTSNTKKITSISNGVLANDEIYVHFNYSGTIITLTYGRGSSAASSDIIKLESAVVYYVTDEKLSQLHTGTYPNTTVSGALRIGNGTSDSNRRNLMLVDWSGTGKFKGDILAFCGADSSGGMSLTKAEENIDAFKYEDANGHVYIDAYRVGRIVSLLCSVLKTPSIAPGANLYQLNLTNAHLPKPLGTNTSGTGIYSNNMIIGNIYYNKTVTPNRYEFVCRNGGSTAVSTVGVGFSITYICQMDEVSGEIKYMDD